ncbi:MAG TPA: hypothetical protein VIT00_09125 [Terrimicrobiaceae bacterium]
MRPPRDDVVKRLACGGPSLASAQAINPRFLIKLKAASIAFARRYGESGQLMKEV